jgi:hypothetical protein
MVWIALLSMVWATSSSSLINTTVAPILLFTSPEDVDNVTGLLKTRGSTLATVPGGLRSPTSRNDSETVYAGVLPNGTFELYQLEPTGDIGNHLIYRYLSNDLKVYSPPQILLKANCSTASIAKNEVTGAYMLVVFQKIDGSNSSISQQAFVYMSPNGVTWTPAKRDSSGKPAPSFSGSAATGLLHHPDPKIGWLSFQRVLQRLAHPKPYPDDLGADTRRVIGVMASRDNGATWTGPKPADFFVPSSTDDPPEMEMFKFQPFWYPAPPPVALSTTPPLAAENDAVSGSGNHGYHSGASRLGGRLAGVMSNYIPSPQIVNPVPAGQSIAAPMAAQEWWIGRQQAVQAGRVTAGATASSGVLDASTPSSVEATASRSVGMACTMCAPSGWARPYLQQTQLAQMLGGVTAAAAGTCAGAAGGAVPPGVMITHAPLFVPNGVRSIVASASMMWLWVRVCHTV